MKVYACYLRIQKVEHWEIVSEDVQFITDSYQKAVEEVIDGSWYSEDGYFFYTPYYKEFDLQ